MIDGFDYGNSPSQVENVDFTNRTVIHTTSAGTQGIVSASCADEILAGSLVCAGAIAAYIREKEPAEVSLVAMGLAGIRPTEEDTLAAEYIASLLEDRPFPELAGRIARLRKTDGAKFFEAEKQHIFPQRDFELCIRTDEFPFVLRLNQEPESGLACMEKIDVVPLRGRTYGLPRQNERDC
jgi:2-phosphosulfolactate phosphatase